MANILIIGEFKDGKLKANAGELVAAAQLLGDSVDAALLYKGVRRSAGLRGIRRRHVHVLDGDCANLQHDGVAASLTEAARAMTTLSCPTAFWLDIGARLRRHSAAAYLSDQRPRWHR